MTDILADLPTIDRFPTVDEISAFATRLADVHPAVAQLTRLGQSRAGDPIELLSITPSCDTRGSVLIIGQPHPNEPIGMATIVELSRRLTSYRDFVEDLGVAWHFVPCADPDGTRLNEGWFAGPWTREHYARNFYRPGGEAQVEWTFPFRSGDFSVDAPLPETQALMRAIDEVQPDVLVSLHNGEMGGAYFYASPGGDALYPKLTELCERFGVPLHRGEAETPLSEVLHPAVYTVPTAQGIYEFATAAGADPAALITGASSHDYATRDGHETFGVAIELPYWRDPRAADTTPDPSGESRRAVVLRYLDLQEESLARLHALLDAAQPLPWSPFADSVRSFLATDEGGWIDGQRQQADTDPDYDRPVTVAELFGARDNNHMFRLRLGGMLLRALPPESPVLADAERLFAEWCAEAAADNKAEVIPIHDLVAVQGGAVLATVEHVLGR